MIADMKRKIADHKTASENYGFQTEPIYALITRVLGREYASVFIVEQLPARNGMDQYQLSDAVVNGEKKIRLRATTGIAAAAAIRWYLQERCDSYIGPITRRMNVPNTPPAIGGVREGNSPFLYRYFFNFCTFGYTCAFWGWKEWEEFLDWLMLSGYNLILNPLGNERVWTNVLQKLGYSLEDARRFISSPVFYPWQCMMNITGWNGAAPEHWYDDRVVISKKLIQRLNEMGAELVVPGFCGMIPDDFTNYYPEVKILRQGNWCNAMRPSLLSYEDAMFPLVADLYYKEQEAVLGNKFTYYSSDPFHEGGDSSGVDMGIYGQVCYRAMQKSSSNAVWVLQGWTTNPNRKMLAALPEAAALIINLKSETNLDGGDDFAHRPWLYGCVNNFGGRRVFRANLDSQYIQPHKTVGKTNLSMVGIAMLPEGIEVDECAFDVFSDICFESTVTSPDVWQTGYIRHRYGVVTPALQNAWTILRKYIYIHDTTATPRESPFCTRPSLQAKMITPSSCSSAYTYHPVHLIDVATELAQEVLVLRDCMQYRFDLTEVLRQVVALTGWGVLEKLQRAFIAKKAEVFCEAVAQFRILFEFQCKVMADSPMPGFYEHEKRARDYGYTLAEKDYFGRQLKVLITAWGDQNSSEILHDYSAREWLEMLENFYLPRWEAFIEYLQKNWEFTGSWEELDNQFPNYEMEMEFCQREECKPSLRKKDDFSYLPELLEMCRNLLEKAEIKVEFQRRTNAMELQ